MNKKFLFLLTLTFLILITSSTFAFSDVDGHWAKDVIYKAESMKIINGYSDDSFKPDAYMTRAELAAVVNRLLCIQTETDKYIPDVTSKEWYHTDIRKAIAMGFIQGDEKGLIHPNEYVTREQAIVIMSRAFCIQNTENVIDFNFIDKDQVSLWAKTQILNFLKEQYITGYPDNSLRPKNNITRAEILTILDRVMGSNVSTNIFEEKVNGNVLIKDKNVTLKNVEIFGNLVVGETVASSTNVINVIINGNLILYSPIDFEKNIVDVTGKIINAYEGRVSSNIHYMDEIYGISFPLPDGAVVYNYDNITENSYNLSDLIIIDIKQDDSYYFKNVNSISNEEIKSQKYDSIYEKIEEGMIGIYPYEIYKDNANSSLLIIKRDNIVYTFLFLNVVSNNILDNVVSNIKLIDGEKVIKHDDKIYKNSKLSLKFTYKDGYVGVDDSYNTGIIYSGDAFFKLFIQVNMITDIDDYSIEEVSSLLKTLIRSDGEIVDEEVKNIINHDAIQFEIISGNDKIISLYVIVGNNLYNFIFKGTRDEMDGVGKDIYSEIVNSMEF